MTKMTTRGKARFVVALLFVAILRLTMVSASPPPIAPPAGAGSFDHARAWSTLERFVGDGTPRAVGTDGHAAAVTRLLALLSETGAEISDQPFPARGWNRTVVPMTNIIALARGKSPPAGADAPLILLCAHYDCVPAGEGAGDNAAGVACAIEILRDLSQVPADVDVAVLFSDGEETGLYGARAFALDHPMWQRVRAVVNVDARGSDGPVYIFETGSDGPWHAAALATLNLPAATTSLASEAYRRMPNGTDFTVFLKGKRPGFNLAFIGSPRNYHTKDDTVANLDPRTVNAMGVSALALVRFLAMNSPGPSPAERTHVWFDFFGWRVLHWPVSICWTVVAIASGVLLLTLRRARRAGRASLLGTLESAASALGGLVLAALLGIIATRLLYWSGRVDLPWPASGVWWGDLLLLLVGATAAWLPARAIAARRALRRGPSIAAWDSWLGGWFLLAALAVLVTALAPGASHPFVAPVGVSAVAAIVALLRRSRHPEWCAAAGAAAALIVWLPLEQAFVDAFGLSLGGFTALRGAILATSVRPLLDSPGHSAA